MKGAYLGPAYSAGDVERMTRRCGAVATRFDDIDALCDHVAALIDEGKVVGSGPHAELMAANPTYREIVLSQLTEQEAAV